MTDTFEFGGEFVWQPTSAHIDNARLTHFMRLHNIPDFKTLMERSTQDIAWFTEAVLQFLDIQFETPYTSVVNLADGFAWPQWCVGGKMNIVVNCLDKYLGTSTESQAAFIWEGEEGRVRTLTYGELAGEVNRTANALLRLGVEKGDTIGIYLPMIPEIVIALLAVARIGAIILPLFSGYGAQAIVTRLHDAEAKVLFTCDGMMRRGKVIDMKTIADEAALDTPSIQKMIVVQRIGSAVNMKPGRDCWWHELNSAENQFPPIQAQASKTQAEDPLMIIYTSGTTGKPKGAVHTHCGFPVKAAQDMAFGTDVRPGDRIYWMTDMGWMMGPWLVFGALLLGATFILYDGAPDYPEADRLWDLVERHRISVLGVSPTLIRALMPLGLEPVKKHNISSLRLFASTGEPWNPRPWMWLFAEVGEGQRPIINYSGGTEVSGGIVMGNPILPMKACAFSGPCPGISADVFDENGKSVIGQVGELVIKAPWIGMTRGFWRDPQRYLATYWSRWKNVWVHGDFAARDQDGLWYILGRSDDTIKIAGKRLGPAEVESLLVSHPEIIEAAAIGVPDEIKGNALVVFCVVAPPYHPCEDLRQELQDIIVNALGKALAPKLVFFVSDLPKTRNGKVMRRIIRAAYLGQDPGDISSLVNPVSIEEIRKAI